MNIMKVRNVQQALPLALKALAGYGVERSSRNGKVWVLPGGMTTVYTNPTERVLFWAEREANPFLHFYESLWMLAGRNDVAPLANIVERMKTFSDDGKTQHGAYGHRWRAHFGSDQLAKIIKALSEDPDDRRQVLQMWDATVDLGRIGKDVPCNLMVTFQVGVYGALDMNVFCRSNDIVWGCYGANAVHFSYLMEYVAHAIGRPVGLYHQISVNWHGYENTFIPLLQKFEGIEENDATLDPYYMGDVSPYPLMSTPVDVWDQDLANFMITDHNPTNGGVRPIYADAFFTHVAEPIMQAQTAYKTLKGAARYECALEILETCHAEDWRMACFEWITRRYNKWEHDKDDGTVNY